MISWDQLKTALLDLVWPEKTVCLCCGRLSGSEVLCYPCYESLCGCMLEAPVCDRCGLPLNGRSACSCKLPGAVRIRSAWWYHDTVAGQLVRKLKFDQVREAAEPLVPGMAAILQEMALPADCCITWITMAESHALDRGFDHAQLLAEGVAEQTGLPCRQLLLRTKRSIRHQVGLDRDERLRNLSGSFACSEQLHGTVILVDDVCTTGSTILTAAECLREAGAEQVLALTAARA